MQQRAAFEVREEQTGASVHKNIAERVEEEIAREVGNGEHAIVGDAHETRLAAAMRHIHLTMPVFAVEIRCHEEGVGAFDHRPCAWRVRIFFDRLRVRRLGRLAHEFEIAQLNVLRAIAEALLDGHFERAVAMAMNHAVHAITPPRMQFDAEHADRCAIAHAGIGGIVLVARMPDGESRRVRRLQKTGTAREERGPGVAVSIDRARDDERQLREELPMLLRHEAAHHAPPLFLHALVDARGFLQRDFAAMPRRVHRDGTGEGHDRLRPAARPPSLELDESGQRFHARQPRVHMAITGQIDVAFGRAGDVAVERDIRDGRMRAADIGDPVARLQFFVDDFERSVRPADDFFGIELPAEHGDETRRACAVGDLACGNGEPALHLGRFEGRFGEPAGIAAFLREVDEDGVRIGDDVIAVGKHRIWPKRFRRRNSGDLCALAARSTTSSS